MLYNVGGEYDRAHQDKIFADTDGSHLLVCSWTRNQGRLRRYQVNADGSVTELARNDEVGGATIYDEILIEQGFLYTKILQKGFQRSPSFWRPP